MLAKIQRTWKASTQKWNISVCQVLIPGIWGLMFHTFMSMCIVLVWVTLCLSLVDLRRTEQLEAQVKYPTGSLGAHHACWPLFSWGTCWPWYLRHRRPRSIAPYGKAWMSTVLCGVAPRGHPRASVRFVGGVSNNADVTQKARHIVCASCVYTCSSWSCASWLSIVQVDCSGWLCKLIDRVVQDWTREGAHELYELDESYEW